MSSYKRNLGGGYSDDDISRFLASFQQNYNDSSSVGAAPDDGLPTMKRPKLTPKQLHDKEISTIPAPPVTMTGVSESTTRICAKLSHKIYKANSIHDFTNLSTDGHDVQMLKFDNHGILQATTPSFAVAVISSLHTLVLVWRGSVTKMDWVVDLAVAPVLSPQWSHVAPSLRAHAGYTALVESDLALHESWIVQEIEKREITQVIVTGHSLAGAMSQIAQVVISAQLQTQSDDSVWRALQHTKLTVRCIQFAAPMSCMLVGDSSDVASRDFWDELSKTSCNLVYASDLLPRAPGNFHYVDTAVRKALVPFVKDKLKDVPIMSMLELFPSALQKLVDLYADETRKQDVRDIIRICQRFQHVGSIIWYQDCCSSPVQLDDYQFRTHSRYQYSIPSEEPFPNRKLREEHVKLPDVLAHDTPK